MSSDPLVIAVDSSTTSTKAIVVDPSGAVVASGRGDITMHQPGPDRYEHDPREWWSSTDAAVSQALRTLTPQDRDRIAAISVTPQRQSFALVDDAGEPIRPGILWLDGRATDEVAQIGSAHVHELSGFQPDVTPSLYKLAWLARHEPDNVARASRVAGVHGYLVHALTGQWVDSQACADSLGLFDMARLDFSDELVALAGLRRDQLPDLVPAGTEIAPLTPEIARAWELPGPIPVIACCGDGQAAGLGCGAIGPDEAYLNMGTALVAGVHSAKYRHGDVYRTDAAGLAGQYVLEIVQNSGAYLAGWFRAELGDPALQGAPDPALDAAAAAVPPGCGGLMTLPYFNAVQSPHWDPLARGAIVGLSGSDGRPQIYRSILEGLSIEMARNLRGLQEDTGTPLTSVRVMGGGQRSPLWRTIMTDCVGLPLTACEQEEISAMGAAVLAMASTGVHGDVAATAKAMARLDDVSEPNMDAHALYREISDVQGRIYGGLKDIFAERAAFVSRHSG